MISVDITLFCLLAAAAIFAFEQLYRQYFLYKSTPNSKQRQICLAGAGLTAITAAKYGVYVAGIVAPSAQVVEVYFFSNVLFSVIAIALSGLIMLVDFYANYKVGGTYC